MYDDRPKPASDPVENICSRGTHVTNEFLCARLKTSSIEGLIMRFGKHKELLLFSDQIDQLKKDFRGDSITLKTFLDLISAGIVFYVVEPEFVESELPGWRLIQTASKERPGDKWPVAALMEELNDKQILFLARVTCSKNKVLLTDNLIEKEIAKHIGIICL